MSQWDYGTGPTRGKPAPSRRLHQPADIENEMHGNGHEFAISNEQQDLIVSLLTAGFSQRSALARAGVPYITFQDWMLKGGDLFSQSRYRIPLNEAVEPYKTFAMRVRSAEAEGEMAASIRLMEAKDWRAQAWYLSRRFPETWAAKPKAASSNPVNADASSEKGGKTVQLYIPDNGRRLTDSPRSPESDNSDANANNEE